MRLYLLAGRVHLFDDWHSVLQERLYLIEEKGGAWNVRLSPLHRALSVHPTVEEAVDATKRSVGRLAPCRIRVTHSGQVVSEWYIRYPDRPWDEVPPAAPPDLPRTVSYRASKAAGT